MQGGGYRSPKRIATGEHIEALRAANCEATHCGQFWPAAYLAFSAQSDVTALSFGFCSWLIP